jgi:hypothetical protein
LNCKRNMDFIFPADWSFLCDKPSMKAVVPTGAIKCTPCIRYGYTQSTAGKKNGYGALVIRG